jgi:hypothetical protein
MKRLLNFSHPLTPEVRAEIEAIEGPFEEIIIPLHLDLERDIDGPIADIEAGDHDIFLQEADLVIPPAMGVAAYLLAARNLSSAYPQPKVVWRKKVGVPPRFVLGGIE